MIPFDRILFNESYLIENNLESQINKITCDLEEILKYYISYIELYGKYKNRINNDKEIKEKDLREILEYYMKCSPEEKECEKDKENYNKIFFNFINEGFNFPLNTILYGNSEIAKNYVIYSVGIIERNKIISKEKSKENIDIDTYKEITSFNDYKNILEKFETYKENGQIEFISSNAQNTSDNFKNICEKARNDKDKNYVLIIDEINRGNISKIFGELITLLEPSKRLGETEELKIRLPYSGEEFGVPKNLYILGTMNTADRSIALLDIVLRRRFNFIEMPPRYELLKQKIEVKNDKIELQELLKAINTRIEFLLDKDHLIGHSYFINIKTFEDLKEIFRNSIIPLLQEYFYDDFEKIREVLNIGDNNDSFIIKKEIPQNFSDTLKTRFQNKPVYVINETEIEDKGFNSHQNYTKIYN